MAREELADVSEDRERRRHHVEGEERLECVEVDVTVRQRVELRRERELAVDVAIGERFDPEAVAREHESLFARVPHGDGEHTAKPLPQLGAPLLVPVNEHLGVAAAAEPVTCPLELVHELAVVVDLAVLHDDDAAVLVRDRLVASGQIDDRQPACGDPDRSVEMRALGVRAAVEQSRRHAAKPIGVDGAAAAGDPADPAHVGSV